MTPLSQMITQPPNTLRIDYCGGTAYPGVTAIIFVPLRQVPILWWAR